MTDPDLAAALAWARALEQQTRETWRIAGEDLSEKDAAVVVLRHVTATRRSLETWIGTRALRAQLHRAVVRE